MPFSGVSRVLAAETEGVRTTKAPLPAPEGFPPEPKHDP